MIKAQFVCPWYNQGEHKAIFPAWFNFYLLTCSHNPEFEWIFFSDSDEFPSSAPPNVTHHNISKKNFSKLVSRQSQINLPTSCIPNRLCDLRPAYGSIFSEFLNAPMWGHCDVDVFWGNLSSFVKDRYIDKFDILTSRGNAMSGHFSLFKNLKDNSFYYKSIPNFQKIIKKPAKKVRAFDMFYIRNLDEMASTLVYKKLELENKIKVLWSCGRSNYPWHIIHFWNHLENFRKKPELKSVFAKNSLTKWEDCKDFYFYDSRSAGEWVEKWGEWEWEKGGVYLNDIEIMYFHFMNLKDSYSSLDVWSNHSDLSEVLKLDHFRFNHEGVYVR